MDAEQQQELVNLFSTLRFNEFFTKLQQYSQQDSGNTVSGGFQKKYAINAFASIFTEGVLKLTPNIDFIHAFVDNCVLGGSSKDLTYDGRVNVARAFLRDCPIVITPGFTRDPLKQDELYRAYFNQDTNAKRFIRCLSLLPECERVHYLMRFSNPIIYTQPKLQEEIRRLIPLTEPVQSYIVTELKERIEQSASTAVQPAATNFFQDLLLEKTIKQLGEWHLFSERLRIAINNHLNFLRSDNGTGGKTLLEFQKVLDAIKHHSSTFIALCIQQMTPQASFTSSDSLTYQEVLAQLPKADLSGLTEQEQSLLDNLMSRRLTFCINKAQFDEIMAAAEAISTLLQNVGASSENRRKLLKAAWNEMEEGQSPETVVSKYKNLERFCSAEPERKEALLQALLGGEQGVQEAVAEGDFTRAVNSSYLELAFRIMQLAPEKAAIELRQLDATSHAQMEKIIIEKLQISYASEPDVLSLKVVTLFGPSGNPKSLGDVLSALASENSTAAERALSLCPGLARAFARTDCVSGFETKFGMS